MRTAAARRAKAFEQAICEQLGTPRNRLSAMLRSLVDGAVVAQVRMEELRLAVARGEAIDDEAAQRWAGILHRSLEALGLIGAGLEARRKAAEEAERRRLLDQHYPNRKWD